MSDELLLEPVELSDAELDLVTGGAATAAAAAGDNFAFAAAATGISITFGLHSTITIANLSFAFAG
jgi:lactobin A/cerein 7B family class IIb bacteriocin